jgi:hypothetical protein
MSLKYERPSEQVNGAYWQRSQMMAAHAGDAEEFERLASTSGIL